MYTRSEEADAMHMGAEAVRWMFVNPTYIAHLRNQSERDMRAMTVLRCKSV